MPIQLRWVGTEDFDRLAETRWMCYSHAKKELPSFKERLLADPWGKPGDYLLAERDGIAVGTATSLPLKMWMRGSSFPCQGVAWVGTVKSARRRGGNEPGIASAVMTEIVRAAREREFVLSALMPFRVSFYEHFGYGLVERRVEWTIPLATIIHHDCPGWRLALAADRPAQFDQWQRAVESGQCDVERPQSRWKQVMTVEEDGMTFVERIGPTGPVSAFAYVTREAVSGRNVMRVQEWSADSAEAFGRLLAFFATMRDQFSFITITTPADLPVNRLLREPQVPHRPIDHPSSDPKGYTRMQLRILDHRKFLESIRWPGETRGKVTVGIAECEGHVSRLAIEIEGGRAKVSPAIGDLDFECLDRQWAAIAAGDLSASSAVRWGLARQNKPSATVLLDALAAGPAPFCREAF